MNESDIEKAYFDVQVGPQSREDLSVNGYQSQYKYKSAGWRHPLLLYIDGVVSSRSYRPVVVLQGETNFKH